MNILCYIESSQEMKMTQWSVQSDRIKDLIQHWKVFKNCIDYLKLL